MVAAHTQRSLLAGVDPRLTRLVAARGLEGGALAYLEELRWPGGVECPRCESDKVGYLEVRKKHYCRECLYQFRVTAGTVLHNSHVSLPDWLLAVRLMLESERGFPATRLQAALGVTYKTAWFVGHRIRAAMSLSLLDRTLPVALARDAGQAPVGAGGEPWLDAAHDEAGSGWLLLRQLIAGDYHRPSIEHLTAYWNESRWRAAHPRGKDAFRETVKALLAAEPLPYDRLVQHEPA
ncbi:MAG TPA: IS1595 family transposase [Gaiellaceae bacterium]|jgi:transposase-like protein|nr:IS1595 family transposase [Gaiellaceae bacterium]